MKLYYYETTNPSKNFGDELNLWLWPRVFNFFDECSRHVFVGIGTIINNDLPQWMNDANNVVFFSSGAGYGNGVFLKKQRNWRIYCVRGPLSAKRLKLPQQFAITDGAVLLKRYFDPVSNDHRKHKFSYMPHFRHGNPHLFQAICQKLGIHYIDPSGDIEGIITDILHSNMLISEAMHGAIIADTLRVPWIPVRTSPRILPFKWLDWCASIKVPYKYEVIQGSKPVTWRDSLYSLRLYLQRQSSAKSLFDNFRINISATEKALDLLMDQLEAVTKKTPYLSDDSHLESLVVRLEEKIENLKQDFQQGLFY
jgi:succinoglycan biosynthesis protein ExoV